MVISVRPQETNEGIILVKLADDLEQITEITVSKGMAIPAFDGMTILKYGVVEVDYNDHDPTRKKFIRPGMVLQSSDKYAVASTNVRLIQARHKI